MSYRRLCGPAKTCFLRFDVVSVFIFLKRYCLLHVVDDDDEVHVVELPEYRAITIIPCCSNLHPTVFKTLQVVDTFNEYSVSAHVTAGRTKLLLLHDRHLRNEDGVRLFLAEVYDLYLRVMLNQLQMSSSKIVNETAFDARVRSFAKKHF